MPVDSFNPAIFALSNAASLAIGVMTGVAAEHFKKRIFSPRLSLSFRADDQHIRESPEFLRTGSRPISCRSRYVRVRVKNRRRAIAHDCRAYLTKIELLGLGGPRVLFAECLQLSWAYLGPVSLELPGDIEVFFDVFTVNSHENRLIPMTQVRPALYEELLTSHGTYRFSVVVAGRDIEPVRSTICVKWEGGWRITDVWEEN